MLIKINFYQLLAHSASLGSQSASFSSKKQANGPCAFEIGLIPKNLTMDPEVRLQWIEMLNKTVGQTPVLCNVAWTNCISRDYYWGTLFISSNHFSDKIFFPVTNFLQVCNKFWQAKQNSDFYRKAIQSWNNVILSSPRQDISTFIILVKLSTNKK